MIALVLLWLMLLRERRRKPEPVPYWLRRDTSRYDYDSERGFTPRGSLLDQHGRVSTLQLMFNLSVIMALFCFGLVVSSHSAFLRGLGWSP